MRSIFLAGLLVWCAACTSEPEFKGSDISTVQWGADFVLTDHRGTRFDTRQMRGKVTVLFFGYTHCPDICAPTLVKLAQARKLLGEKAEGVQVLFVTVDPKHDTPAQLAKFLGAFDPAFVGLTGSAEQIAAVAADYRVVASTDHSGVVFVRDAQGKLRLLFRNDFAPADLASDLLRLIEDV